MTRWTTVVVWQALLLSLTGCATIRVTDSIRTADEEFLLTEAATRATAALSMDALRGRSVWVVSEYAFSTTRPYDQSFLTNQVRVPDFQRTFMVAAFRSRLLQSGARLAASRQQAEVIVELRSEALSVNRIDFMLGVPALFVPTSTSTNNNNNNNNNGLLGSGSLSGYVVSSPSFTLYRNVKQYGFGSIAFVAYWRGTGELLAISGPFIGHTFRSDTFIFGYALPALGDIPPTQPRAGK